MVKLADTLQRRRDRAKGMRTAAGRMRDPEARRIALGIAEGYERLARHIEERATVPRSSSIGARSWASYPHLSTPRKSGVAL